MIVILLEIMILLFCIGFSVMQLYQIWQLRKIHRHLSANINKENELLQQNFDKRHLLGQAGR